MSLTIAGMNLLFEGLSEPFVKHKCYVAIYVSDLVSFGKIDYLHGLRVYYSLGWEILFRFGCLKKVVLRAKFLVAFLGLLCHLGVKPLKNRGPRAAPLGVGSEGRQPLDDKSSNKKAKLVCWIVTNRVTSRKIVDFAK
uniref:Uncharacterized protein n=1 Tax=Lactuca sativa TaxID=4236 RepID=A0A9R1WB19_LACSA|nr:hypothetical protein LSAT_V11C300146870 [Lactuca sativa]